MATCSQSPLTTHPILIFTLIFHPMLRASSQFSVLLPPLLSSHPHFPSSTMTSGAMKHRLPPQKTQRRRTSLNAGGCQGITGLCKSSSHVYSFVDEVDKCTKVNKTKSLFLFIAARRLRGSPQVFLL